ncbi:unnamed protein product [Rotaria socialis]|uniref:Uncharacterized protein n=1 Tax=Rotaria socialis TaxID=392032 RepID=A0A818C5E2_9BILA|nr:unnamed protein product [Rotaria socialis]CAF3419084.1 unnamed protein product [Rotaria socialis]CAF3470509.1 unnamed protein product [Rotaria socialis]CAF3494882.1 unnamed protein product [Rotaria socialis]CAF3574022.1 unnamed protein product [Rotaria socialis]
MSSQNLILDTSILPTDILSFSDDHFYRAVEKIAGSAEAKLLEIQGIRSVYSFLHTEDVFSILSLSCSALRDIKKLICFEADDRSYMIKPGCRGSIRYLHQLLHQKHEEHQKDITLKFKRNKQSSSPENSQTIHNISQDSSQAGPTSSHQQPLTTADSMNKLNHYSSIISMMNEWFEKYCETINVSAGTLTEKEDFQLFIVSNGTDEEASISCSCGIKVQLTKNHHTFSLSNYYKHVKSKSCMMMKNKKKNNSNAYNEPNTIDEQECLDDERSQDISMTETIQSSDSSIAIDNTVDIVQSSKRSIGVHNTGVQKKQRTKR